MTSSELKTAARRALKDNFVQKMLLIILPIAITVISNLFVKTTGNYLSDQVTEKVKDNASLSDVFNILTDSWQILLGDQLLSILMSIIIAIFTASAIFNYIEIFRGEKTEINLLSDILRPFRDGSFIKIVLITVIIQVVLKILSFILVIGWIPAILLGFGWSQAIMVLHDKLETDSYTGVWNVLSTSYDMMRGYKFKYFLFNLTFIGWMILAVFAWGLPNIWIMPFMNMAMVAFYEARKQDRL
ncbi:DUF975 family protein [Lactococcus insecticola]|uniref:Beta-carotene 15,15'-monooxygenase n=1 Tax=Pseudolactococcus insecticola TaxID=2709158 RepID=A0A6A0B518_9LACT|nr:DUF975 family protein [Lactococcus insecticola]GFH40489.1 hypothetical protein Hs20B_08870 [Lactococcus insecticola]